MEKVEVKSKQHVQVPNDMTKHNDLEMRDMHVYANIKRHLNSKTKECFPSLELIAKECGYSIPTVKKSIDILKKLHYIMVRREGRKNVYSFNTYKNFEPISPKFLDNEDISPGEKGYIIGSQQYQFKDEEGIGKMTYSDKEIAEMLNTSEKTISRLNKSLVEKGLLSIIKTDSRNPETGIVVNEKFFKLDELGQEIIWTLQRHEDDIDTLKETQASDSKSLKIVLKELDEIKRREKERDKVLKDNGIDISTLLPNNEIIL